MSGTYKLVNPYIKGDFKCEYSGSSALDAARKCWSNLSEYFTNNIPSFAFSMQKGGSYYHFSVSEDVTDEGMVNFSIKQLSNIKNETTLKDKLKAVKSGKLRGGKKGKKDDDSDSDSDEEELYNRLRYERIKKSSNAIYYWWYYPNVYTRDFFYVPTFTYPLTPYIEIDVYDTYYV